MHKSKIRKKILKIRKRDHLKKNIINFKAILNIIKKKKIIGKNIGGYYPYNYEVDVMQILNKFQKLKFTVSMPKIKKNFQMDFFKWSSKDPLIVNKYGIPEPISDKIKYPDILLVPVVAYDKYLNRIGYGGGFYDRYIKKIKKKKKITAIGFAYSFQEVRKIPTKNYDIKLDFVITEKD